MNKFLTALVSLCLTASAFGQTAPVATIDTGTICSYSNLVFTPLSNDTDADGDSLFISQILTPGKHGTDTLVNGFVLYQATDSVGTDSLTYVVCDAPKGGGASLCDTSYMIVQIVNCTVIANQRPVTKIDIVPGIEDIGTFPFDPRSNDTDPDGNNLTWTALLGPFNGTVSPFLNQWRYKPNPNFNGIDIMPYRVCDDGVPQLCNVNIVVFIIAPVNDPPVAHNDTFTVYEDDSANVFPVLKNDTDIDGDTLTPQIVSQPQHGYVDKVGKDLVYTPFPNYNGPDEFQYEACDPSHACSKARVYITVLPVNDPPVAYNDSTLLKDNETSKHVDVVLNDTDIDNDTLKLTSVWGGSFVTGSIVNDGGKLVVDVEKKDPKACGNDSLFYSVCDGSGSCDTATIYVLAICKFDNFLPQGFSPNGDGINDYLVFPALQYFRPVQLDIYNRWGHPVYTSDDYNNDWDGKAQDLNQPLPDGTYYYTVKVADGTKYIQFCVINR